MIVVVEGYCSGITRGSHTISLYITRCPQAYNGNPIGDAQTGYNGNRNRILVEEIKLGTDVVAGMLPTSLLKHYISP